MLTMKQATARAIGAAVLAAGVLIGTNALAIDPGNQIDQYGCEHGQGYYNNNWCNTGANGVHIQANIDQSGIYCGVPGTGYYFVADGNGSSAYGGAKCANGVMAMKGQSVAGSMGPFCCPAGVLGNQTVCGPNMQHCENQLP